MSMEEHTPSTDEERDNAASIASAALGGNAPAAAAAAAAMAADAEDDTNEGSSANNVIPTAQLKHGLDVAKSLWSSTIRSARKSLEDINESQAMQRVKEVSKPLTTAVVEGAKVVGEAAKPVTTAIVDGAKVAGAKLHEGAEAAKPQLEKGLHAVQKAGEQVVQQAKPALQQAGEAIKKAGATIQDQIGGGGKGGEGGEGGGDGQPPHTV